MSFIITIALISCVPTTDESNPSLEETPRPLNTVSDEPTDGIDKENHDLDVVTTTELEETLVAPTQSVSKESEEIPVEPKTTEEISTMTPSNNDVPNPDKLPQVQTATEDLANKLNISTNSIEIISVELITWPNNSMGCPQPGMAYKQVPVDGLLIRLSVEGVEYNYHSGGSRDPFLCQPSPPVKSTPLGLNIEDFITPPSGSINQ